MSSIPSARRAAPVAPSGRRTARGARLAATVGPLARAVRAGQRTVTAFGWGVLAAATLAWILAATLGWREAAILAAAGVLLVVLATVFTLGRAIVRIEFALDPQRVTVGAPAAGQIRVTNASARRLFPLRLELPVGQATALFDLPSLGREETHDELFVVPTHRRAVITVGPATTVRGDPLGLLRRSVEWTGVSELFVHPRISRLDTLGAGFLRDLEGHTTDDISMSDLAFHTLRDYVPGDDRRYVHWRSTARTGRLLVRQFVDTRRSHVSVVVDADPAAYAPEEDFELAVSIGGSLAVRALRDEQDTTICVGPRVTSGRTPRQVLDELSRADAAAATLSAQATTTLERAADTSIALLITGPGRSFAELRRGAFVFDRQVRTVACVVDSRAAASLSVVDRLTVLTVPALTDLPGLLRAAALQ